MAYTVEGDYFEACNCRVSCPCIFLNPATNATCELFTAWHITRGMRDGVDLAGLNVALAVHSPQQMTDGGWRVALYLDDRANPEQASALGAIFSGQSGGHLANLAPLIGDVAAAGPARISFENQEGVHKVTVSGVLEMQGDELKGMDGQGPIVIANPLLGVVTQPVRQAKAVGIHYDGPWAVDVEGTNSFVAEFRYEA